MEGATIMAVVYGGSSAISTLTSATSATPAMPTGWAAGNLLLVYIVTTTQVVFLSTPGYTLLTSYTGGNPFVYIYYRVAVAGDTAQTFVFTPAANGYAAQAYYTGNSTSNPIGAKGSVSTGATITHTSTAFTSTSSNSIAILFDATVNIVNLVAPSGWTTNTSVASATGSITTCSKSTSAATSGTGGNVAWTSLQFEIVGPSISPFAMPMMGL